MTRHETLKEFVNAKIEFAKTETERQGWIIAKHLVEKDLEILEIIKKWSFIQDNYKEGYGTYTQFLCNIHTVGMKEDFEKIKEWLERAKE